MNKPLRNALRFSAGLLVLIVGLSYICLDGVDYRPYFRSPYYAATLDRIHSQTATNELANGELEAGFGRARLTPAINAAQDDPSHGRFRSVPLAGYGSRKGKPATGVHDDLYVKAVALRVKERLGIMVGADALIIPREVTELAVDRLARELGLRREQIYLSATHTHSSLGGWGSGLVAEQFAGGYQPGVPIWFANCIVSAVREAVADLKPASYGFGSFAMPAMVRNRLVGRLGQVDPEFSYAMIRQITGKSAVLGSFSAHATVLSGDMMEFSADYPGCWQTAVERATDGMAVFLAGGVGSHSPVPGAPGFEGAQRMGRALAEQLLDCLPRTQLTNQVAFDFLGVEVTMPPLATRLSDTVRIRPWIAARLLPVNSASYLQVFRLNRSLWISTPCDFSGELALGIKDSLRVEGFRAVITSFNGDYVGYVVPSRYYHLEGYEPRLMSFFGPYVPDYFDELIRGLARELAHK